MRVAKELVEEIDAEAAVRGLACGPMADRVIELGLKALRAEEARLAADAAATPTSPTQGALMTA